MRKLIILIITLVLLLTICFVVKGLQEKSNKIASEALQKEKKQVTTISSKEDLSSTITSSVNTATTDVETEIINYINAVNMEVSDITNNESENLTEKGKLKLKQYFITLTDFIFYNGRINNITFAELSTSSKQKILEIYTIINQKIETVWPNYKETITETSKNIYANIKEQFKKLKEELQDQYKDNNCEKSCTDSVQIFENNIEKLEESTSPTIDYLKEKSQETYQNITEQASNWYQNFKESGE